MGATREATCTLVLDRRDRMNGYCVIVPWIVSHCVAGGRFHVGGGTAEPGPAPQPPTPIAPDRPRIPAPSGLADDIQLAGQLLERSAAISGQ